MDPASATVAFVGFAASLVTLAAVVANSSKILYNLRIELKDAPEDVRRLIQSFRLLEKLLGEIQARLDEHRDENVQRRLQELWAGSAAQMQEDMEGFGTVVAKLHHLQDGSTHSSKTIRLRIRHYFDKDAIAKYQQKMSIHTETLTLIQSLINGQKLDDISQNTTKLVDTSRTGFQTVCSRLSSMELFNHGSHHSQQDSLDQIKHMLQDRLEIGSFQPRISATTNRHRRRSGYNPVMATTVYWSWQSYSLPIGSLKVDVSRMRQSSSSDGSSFQDSDKSEVSITFVPPRWLSNIMLQFALETRHNLHSSWPGLSANLTPFTINNNPLLSKAIEEDDIAGLQKLFRDGLARPTDYLPKCGLWSYGPVSLLEAHQRFRSFSRAPWNRYEMYKFLMGSNPTEAPKHAILITYYGPIGGAISRAYLHTFLASGGLVTVKHFANNGWIYYNLISSFVESPAGFDCIRDCLAGQLEPWIVDELMPIDAWLIGILAHVDLSFRKSVETYMSNFRSPFDNKRSPCDDLFQSAFGIANIVAQVKHASRDDRVEFLKVISTSGTSSMLEPFLETAIDLDDGEWDSNCLGAAAARGNIDTFNRLLATGASTALAIPLFLDCSKGLSAALFEELFLAIVANMAPCVLPRWTDPILAILQHDDALEVCPRAIEILFSHQIFKTKNLHGGDDHSSEDSYMCNAIVHDHPSAVKAFLDHGAKADVRIEDLFPEETEGWELMPSYTWLTLAVDCGRASCTDVLVSHGANILSPDGHGNSALQLAISNAAGEHPREMDMPGYCDESPWSSLVTAEDDKEVLAILERALETRFEGSAPEVERDLVLDKQEDWSFVSRLRRSLVFAASKDGLAQLAQYVNSCIPYSVRNVWHLSFQGALLMRIGYVTSYCILLCYESVALMVWLKDLPRPPRAFLPAAVVLMLTVIWMVR